MIVLPLMDSGFTIPVFSPGYDPIACLNKAMASLTSVASSRFPSTNNKLKTSSNPRNQATIQDGRVIVQKVQGRQGQSYFEVKGMMLGNALQPKRSKECNITTGFLDGQAFYYRSFQTMLLFRRAELDTYIRLVKKSRMQTSGSHDSQIVIHEKSMIKDSGRGYSRVAARLWEVVRVELWSTWEGGLVEKPRGEWGGWVLCGNGEVLCMVAGFKVSLEKCNLSGLVLDGPSVPMSPPFINSEEDETVRGRLKQNPELARVIPLSNSLEKLGDPGKFLIPCGFSELKCKALANLGASINLMPLSVWKTLGLPELIFPLLMTHELANRCHCTSAGIARDVFVPVEKFTFPADFVIIDYESDPRVPLILGRPFLRTVRALIDVHGEEMILRDGDERLILNMRHDTSSYSNKPKKESINMIDIYNVSHKDYLEDLFANEKATNHQSGNPSFSSHTDLTSSKVINPLSGNPTPILKPVTKSSSSPTITSFEESDLIWEEFEAYLAIDSFPPENDDPVDLLREEFADELALITFPPRNDDLPFDIESDRREIEYLLNHDPTKEMDYILEDSMFTDEHTLDYSSPPLYDDVDDDLVELESDNNDVYDDPFDSKEDKIKESKLLIDELDPPRSSDFLPSPKCDSVLYEDFPEVDALPSTNNEDKVFNPGILIHENLFEVTIRVTPDKNVKKLSSSNASLILEDFDPPLYELPFHKEVSGSETLLSFSSKNEEKVFKPEILTSKGVHTSLLPELSHRAPKAFKVIKNFESPMEIFPCSYGEDIRVLDVPIAPDFEASHAHGFVLRSLELHILSFIMGIQYPNLID
ncbi:reverse transcriptase domain-containing protein [Tanacetum coccineum]